MFDRNPAFGSWLGHSGAHQRRQQSAASWRGRVPVAPINNVQDIFNDPHVKARQMLSTVEHPGTSTPVTIVSSPIKLLGSPRLPPRRAPRLDEHKTEILAQFGIQRRSR